jgi:hypothetical protein
MFNVKLNPTQASYAIYVGSSLFLTGIASVGKFIVKKEQLELIKAIQTIAGGFIGVAGIVGMFIYPVIHVADGVEKKFGSGLGSLFIGTSPYIVFGALMVGGELLLK